MKNFKVKCVDLNGKNSHTYTVGRVYEVINGVLISNDGFPIGDGFENVDDVNEFSISKFELVEDKPSFKVRCVKVTGNPEHFTKGKVYEVKNGTIVADNGYEFKGWSNYGEKPNYKEFSKWWNDDQHCSSFELIPEPQQFTKDMLKTGMRVERRDGQIKLVLQNVQTETHGFQELLFADFECGSSIGDRLKNDLTHETLPSADIVRIYDIPAPGAILDKNSKGPLLWQRPEIPVLKHSDLVEIVGHEFEYVKE